MNLRGQNSKIVLGKPVKSTALILIDSLIGKGSVLIQNGLKIGQPNRIQVIFGLTNLDY